MGFVDLRDWQSQLGSRTEDRDALIQNGAFVDVLVAAPPTDPNMTSVEGVEGIPGRALLDTGCKSTGVDQSLLQALGIQPIDRVRVSTVMGRDIALVYPVLLHFPETLQGPHRMARVLGFNLEGWRSEDGDGSKDVIALIGRDVLSVMFVVYNGFAGQVIVTW